MIGTLSQPPLKNLEKFFAETKLANRFRREYDFILLREKFTRKEHERGAFFKKLLSRKTLLAFVFIFKRSTNSIAAAAGRARTDADTFGGAVAFAVVVDAVFDTAGNTADMLGDAFIVLMFHVSPFLFIFYALWHIQFSRKETFLCLFLRLQICIWHIR